MGTAGVGAIGAGATPPWEPLSARRDFFACTNTQQRRFEKAHSSNKQATMADVIAQVPCSGVQHAAFSIARLQKGVSRAKPARGAFSLSSFARDKGRLVHTSLDTTTKAANNQSRTGVYCASARIPWCAWPWSQTRCPSPRPQPRWQRARG